jgi:hypothetical protein
MVYANGKTNYKCRKHDPGTSFPTEASFVQHPTTSRVPLELFNSSQKVEEYKRNPVSSPKKGLFINLERACQAVRTEMGVPRVHITSISITHQSGMLV